MARSDNLILKNGLIEKVFYPVFPPDKNAEDVIEWLSENPIHEEHKAPRKNLSEPSCSSWIKK